MCQFSFLTFKTCISRQNVALGTRPTKHSTGKALSRMRLMRPAKHSTEVVTDETRRWNVSGALLKRCQECDIGNTSNAAPEAQHRKRAQQGATPETKQCDYFQNYPAKVSSNCLLATALGVFQSSESSGRGAILLSSPPASFSRFK